MALPSSGPISGSQISAELGTLIANISLGGMADSASFSAPDAYSDFYGFVNIPTGLSSELYSNNLVSSTSWTPFYSPPTGSIDFTPYNGRTCRLAVHYSNGTTGTSYQGDFQIGSIVTLGTSSLNFQYSLTDWQTTRANTAATSTAYNAATFYTLADGTTSERWNRRNTSAPPSGGTGLAPGSGTPPGTQYYAYTETSGQSSAMLGFGFWLRSPAVTFASSGLNEIILAIAHSGSNMGTYKVFLDVTV